MDKQKERALYRRFSTVMVLTGGMIGGWVFLPLCVGLYWLVTEMLLSSSDGTWGINEMVIAGFLPFFGVLGWLFGMPAAWLTARSVRKRGLRRNGKGCLKTAVWGAWWGAAATGGPLLFLGGYIISQIGQPTIFPPTEGMVLLAVCLAIFSLCGLVSAALLSLLLPKPETDSQTTFRQPEQET